MALSIKTEKADQLARDLVRLTGETMTEAVTVALEERLARKRAERRETPAEFIARIQAFTAKMREGMTKRGTITQEEWDLAGFDSADEMIAEAEKQR